MDKKIVKVVMLSIVSENSVRNISVKSLIVKINSSKTFVVKLIG